MDAKTNLMSFAQSEDTMQNNAKRQMTISQGELTFVVTIPQGMMPHLDFSAVDATRPSPLPSDNNMVHVQAHAEDATFEDVEEDVVYDIPEELQSAEARALLNRAQETGYLDYDWQPLEWLSCPQVAMLADFITNELCLVRPKWSIMERFWGKKNLRQAYERALAQEQFSNFTKEMEKNLRKQHK